MFASLISTFIWFLVFLACIGIAGGLIFKSITPLTLCMPIVLFVGFKLFAFLAHNVLNPVIGFLVEGIGWAFSNMKELAIGAIAVVIIISIVRAALWFFNDKIHTS